MGCGYDRSDKKARRLETIICIYIAQKDLDMRLQNLVELEAALDMLSFIAWMVSNDSVFLSHMQVHSCTSPAVRSSV